MTASLGLDETGTSPAWTIVDVGAAIVAAEPCRNADVHTAVCVVPEGRFVEFAVFELGDLHDRFSGRGPAPDVRLGNVRVFGGPGADELAAANDVNVLHGEDGNDSLTAAEAIGSATASLKGGADDDRLTGGPGSDTLDGGGGRDELHGGDGEDFLRDGDRDGAAGEFGPGPDLIDGGPGDCCLIDGGDRVIYDDRTTPVHVDLADGKPDGAAGEGDTLIGVESVHGGRGDDRLLGDDQDNALYGGPGRDRLSGRGGHDTLRPGTGGASIACGAGLDWVEPSSVDLLRSDCESIDGRRIDVYRIHPHPTRRGSGALGYRLACPARDEDDDGPAIQRCTASVEIRERGSDGRLLAAGVLPAGRWESHVITLALTPSGRRLASRRGGVLAEVRLAYRYTSFRRTWTPAMRWSIRFKLNIGSRATR